MELDCIARTLAASTSSWSPPCRTYAVPCLPSLQGLPDLLFLWPGALWDLVGRSSGHQGLATLLLSSVVVLRLHSEVNMHGCRLPSRPVLSFS